MFAQTWSPLGAGVNDQVNALKVFNGELYAGGKFTQAGGNAASHVAKWDGTSWTALGAGMPFEAYSLTVYNNQLYASYYDIYKWTGSTWVSQSSPFGGLQVTSMIEYNGELFVGSEGNVGKFNGSTWTTVASVSGGSASVWPRPFVLAIYNGELYVGGDFNGIGGITADNIAKWNGTTWTALGSGVGPTQTKVSAMTVYNGELYVAGTFGVAGGVTSPSIAKWNGTNWSAVGTGLNGPVTSLQVFNGNLFVGGYFSWSQPYSVSSFATWNGTSWLPSGAGLNNYVRAMTDFNGQLVAGGNFTNIPGSNYVAAFTQCTAPPSSPGSVFGNNNPCSGTTQLYYIGPIVPGPSYTWTLPAGWTGSSSTNIITATPSATSGNVSVASINACGSSAPISFPVTVIPSPASSITTIGQLDLCPGTSLTLLIPATGNAYQWFNGTSPIAGATSNSYVATTAGNYSVEVTSGPCSSHSASIPVTVLPAPPIPIISVNGNILSATPGFFAYQWYRNNSAITNATSQTFTPSQSGNYHVVGIDINGCTAQSAVFPFTSVGIQDIHNSSTLIFPNPGNGLFTINFPEEEFIKQLSIEITDPTGKIVHKETIADVSNKRTRDVNLQHLSAGPYMIKLISDKNISIRQIVKL